MSNEQPEVSKAQQLGTIVGAVLAIVAFQALIPEKTEPGFDFVRVLWAGCAGAAGALVGAAVGRLFAR
ncbi:MAG: hypothetical protein AAGD14_14880 [Planctomycetota bacterium]